MTSNGLYISPYPNYSPKFAHTIRGNNLIPIIAFVLFLGPSHARLLYVYVIASSAGNTVYTWYH